MYTLKLQREDVYLRLLEKAKSEDTTVDDLLEHWLDLLYTDRKYPAAELSSN